MFVFMKETMNEASSVRINTTAQNEAPITLAGTGVDGSGHAVEYIATLVARPLQSVSPPDARPPDGTQVRRDLGILRRSPYFSTDLLQDLQPDVKNMERPQPPRMKPQLPRMESPRAHDCSTDDPWDSHHLGLVSEEAAEKHVFALVEQVKFQRLDLLHDNKR